MKKKETEIIDAIILEPEVFEDNRGIFFESYNRALFAELGIHDDFPQDNHSISSAGVLRGLHFQYPPKAMAKLVRCVRGRVFDVIVDMRQDSPTFTRWIDVELTSDNRRMLYIPAGCAHGFYVLSDCDLLYKCAALFDKTFDGGFAWNDPEIGIRWPFEGAPILSDRDAHQPSFAEIVSRVNS
mgnify:CR=1 FL=1